PIRPSLPSIRRNRDDPPGTWWRAWPTDRKQTAIASPVNTDITKAATAWPPTAWAEQSTTTNAPSSIDDFRTGSSYQQGDASCDAAAVTASRSPACRSPEAHPGPDEAR